MVTENPDRMVDLDGFCHHIIIYRGKNKKNSQASKREMQLILFGTRKTWPVDCRLCGIPAKSRFWVSSGGLRCDGRGFCCKNQ
jgi:hypothetical protein